MNLPSGVEVVAVRTPTLPPATHTNTWIVGEGTFTVFDPASPYEDEQRRLATHVQRRIDRGERFERIALTHHHQDHVSGAIALRDAFFPRVPIAAHPITAARVAPHIHVDEPWHHQETKLCGGLSVTAHFTPGHAPGHLVFQEARSKAVIAGDMVAGIGTILIDPLDGDLGEYLASLEAMRKLAASMLLPAHGPSLTQPDAILSFYIAHRHQRTEQIRQALDQLGTATPLALVPLVYADLPAEAHKVGAIQITAHLLWMQRHGLADLHAGSWQLSR